MGKILPLLFILGAQPMLRSQTPPPQMIEDGVQLYQRPGAVVAQPSFWEVFTSVFSGAWNPPAHFPFRRSVAFLVGVSDYKNLKKLPGVDNDLNRMRDFLLNKSGFDQVYVARGAAATPAVVQHYMMDFFQDSGRLGTEDRLFFYYSGHGDDAGGNNPYLQFADAIPGRFGDTNVLAVDSYRKWSSRISAKHALFMFDACLAGEVITPQGNEEAERVQGLLDTLSGKGSRTIVTAGTFSQNTWYEGVKAEGHSVFTEQFLAVMQNQQGPALMSIDEVIGKVELLAADYARKQGVEAAIPQAREFETAAHPGRFVLINSQSKDPKLPANMVAAMGLTAKGSDGAPSPAALTVGTIEVSSNKNELLSLSIDGRPMGTIEKDETRRFLQIAAGKHLVTATGATQETKEIVVSGGLPAFALFGSSPIDTSGKTPVGTFVFRSLGGMSGEAYVDNFSIGRLEANGAIVVRNLIPGAHKCRVANQNQESIRTCNVEANQTVDIGLSPPTGLVATPL
jgi:hypothetical protein